MSETKYPTGYRITMHAEVAERLLAMRNKTTEPLVAGSNAVTHEEADRLIHESLLTHHSLLAPDRPADGRHDPETQLYIDPYNDLSIGFCRSG